MIISKANAMTLATAISSNCYLEFTLTPAVGKVVTISSIDVCAMTQSGVGTVSLLSSVKGFTADNLISSIATGLPNEVNIKSQNLPVSGHVDLSSATTFRFYFNSTANWGFNYKAVGIGNRHEAETTAALIVNGIVGLKSGTEVKNAIASNLEVYPNPVVDKLSMNFGTDVNNAVVSILDLQGRSIMSQSIISNGVQFIDVNNLKSGIYVVKVIADGKVMNSKFVKK